MTEEKNSEITLDIQLPAPEAADLAGRAAAEGISTPEYIGYHALRSAYGVLHPRVVAIDRRERETSRDTEG